MGRLWSLVFGLQTFPIMMVIVLYIVIKIPNSLMHRQTLQISPTSVWSIYSFPTLRKVKLEPKLEPKLDERRNAEHPWGRQSDPCIKTIYQAVWHFILWDRTESLSVENVLLLYCFQAVCIPIIFLFRMLCSDLIPGNWTLKDTVFMSGDVWRY